MEIRSRFLFEETQSLNQKWTRLIVLFQSLVTIFVTVALYSDVDGLSFFIFVVPIWFFLLVISGIFLLPRMKTKIDAQQISLHFHPFFKKTIPLSQIKSAEVLNYGFVGGWGIRLWTKFGTVYNTKGNKGLALVLKNGKKLVIGTQREQELKKIVAQIVGS